MDYPEGRFRQAPLPALRLRGPSRPLSLLDGRAYITEGGTVHLSNDSKRPYLREYVALGDNSTRENSFDSRYWGPVRQYNIVGPASFCLWPFTSHWGLIP
ncbi:S26 family signal peptidase [Akkermansia muciniphila]|uniref:S26 family signal peptidase n=1 Tax=Akkermansia muciniphila TaxID=239935 RepID=UPI000FE33052|nr:S26 family signal peptidase [Akkermansia muciniphila]QHV56231.1 hypothetical protein DMI72_08545 [Akkermansia muciniphila]